MTGSVHMRDVQDDSDAYYDSDEEFEYAASEDDSQNSESREADEVLELDQGRSSHKKGAPYRIIDASALKRVQDEAVDVVVSILSCKPSVARALLRFYRWDSEKIMSIMADRGTEHVFKAAGVVYQPEQPAAGASKKAKKSSITCETCFTENLSDECTTMDCGHAFCNDCWRQHIMVKVQDGNAKSVTCMAFKCGAVCDEDKVTALIKGDEHILQKYKQSLLESYMEDNAKVRFCPSVPWCGRAIEVDGDPYLEPECCCGTTFCFRCGNVPHSPCTCEMWRMWEEKTSGDSETKNWMMANTKPCPKCTKPVEKNGGCNHVTCKCGQSFCWLCGAATGRAHTWQNIEGHQCGRYKDEYTAKIDEAARLHKRYMHYFERYKAHADSFKKEKVDRSKLQESIEALMDSGLEARDYSWLTDALNQLKIARHILANSYVFAYFFFGNELYKEDFTPEQNTINQNLFEDAQQMLETEVEVLSSLTESAAKSIMKPEQNKDQKQVASSSGSGPNGIPTDPHDPQTRVAAINRTITIRNRIQKLHELIENDLYGRLQSSSAQIAPLCTGA